MECFNELLLKLREVHEREVEGWQVKVQELSSKKGCDSKRMEELFTRNQQMKEQQRLLTENIKTLENRLRAGLCDRCTVTQEVAKRKQQEFEASQLQSLQHLSLLASEITNLNKENKRLRDDLRNLRAALDSSSSVEVKAHSPTDRLGSAGPGRASSHPADSDADQRTEEPDSRQMRESTQSCFDPYKPLLLPSVSIASTWKTDHISTRTGERRVPSVEGLDQHSSLSPQVLLKNSPSLTGGDIKPSRHVLHAPVPCHPNQIKSSSVPLSWPRSKPSDWVAVNSARANPAIPPSPRLSMSCFNSMMPLGQQVSMKRQVFSHPWQKQSSLQPPAKEPTVVVRLSNLPEYMESPSKPAEKKESLLAKAERASDERLKEACDAPLDLSDRGKSKPSHTQRECSPSAPQGGAHLQKSPDSVVKVDWPTPVSSPSPAIVRSSSSCSPPVKQEQEGSSDRSQEQEAKGQEEDVNRKTDQSNEKKVPVLTISLRPVVVLETLNSALQKKEAPSSNGKSPAEEPVSSTDDQEEEEDSGSGQDSSKSGKKKRALLETQTDRDSDTADLHQEKKLKITMRAERNSPC